MRLALSIALAIAACIGVQAAARCPPALAATSSEMRLSGNVPRALYPGATAQPIPVTLHNPTRTTVFFTRVVMTVRPTGARGCHSDWFRVSRVRLPREGIAVRAGRSITLPAAGVAAPKLRMIDSGTDQDACQHATVRLSYHAQAHSTAAANDQASGSGASGTVVGALPFTGFELALMAALGLVALGSGVAMRLAARPRGNP